MQNPYNKESQTIDKAQDYASSAIQEGKEKIQGASADFTKKLQQGQEQIKQLVSKVDKQLHDNPWPVVGGVAVGCLLLGFLMGTSRANTKS